VPDTAYAWQLYRLTDHFSTVAELLEKDPNYFRREMMTVVDQVVLEAMEGDGLKEKQVVPLLPGHVHRVLPADCTLATVSSLCSQPGSWLVFLLAVP
jgi:hypothetical protein